MMMKSLIVVLAAAAVALADHEDVGKPLRAITRISSPHSELVQGNLTFTQLPDGKVRVEGVVLGMTHGLYGMHVHEKGDITGGCLSTGGHFNPEHKNHGHPNDEDRHVGDLGNLEFDENRIGRVDFVDSKICLTGPHSILGRAIVLHEKADDFGRSSHPDSKKTGNAGGRVACGVIGILDPVGGWHTGASSRPSLASIVLAPVAALLLLVH
ncbi:superoxide dismutase [Cu-Zn] 2 isoform X1 [Plutella xylostella]|uniref:superoxide dismutase [Cu-Zn] 2 isoform X1 n=2 Tax=Plutella xylostella TaxID=51655 RepID=UPI002032196E|nr:superoxide dismutase [Cu-Zn] 2 isoform X1 [Plutella xylostella]XP_011551443.3 superoxide dismutase [Cu-Zn] 2 isoform X1 [Plutella xylostella]XP_037973730.2 superoxide dismutase [Cu-Zn] 2 isoform X1 [Plutella xylostella]